MALALTSSGIAAILLQMEELAHSALKLPSNIKFIETPTYNIFKTSRMGKVLQKCKLIVWQTSPVILCSTSVDKINACLKYSTLWQHVRTLKLTTNMRVQLQND
ncbi:unnamed protein product [Onchocerca ochengi]|uniref:ATP-dependent DNA helicase n=1 Tax=Onchocerca ochengi TaxID=42157 RepID=A0A182ETM6_ONCOC|nr:unnamed protein product [Onchocerca ochengi]